MKKNLFYFVCLLAVGTMILAACSNEDLATKSVSNQTVSAVLPQEEAQGRTTLNGLQVVWNTGDAISVFAENGEVYTNNQGTITTGVGETDATFSVTVDGTSKVAAACPYTSTNSYNGSVISMTMADSYTYTENGIGGAPMAALISDQNANIAFKNAGALMGLTVNNIPAGYNKAILTSKGEQAITGVCEIAFDTNGNPTLTATSGAIGKAITINFDAAQTKTNKTFYFPIPVNSYSALEFSISNGSENKVLKTKALDAKRSIRYKSTLTLDEVTGSTPVDAANAADATQKLAEGSNSVSVTIPDSDSEPTISLPVSDNQTSLSFEPIPTGKIVTIQATTEGTAVSDQVTISASSDENSSNSFNINLPNSTVTLDANGETATYNEVTASTAENTLIVNKSVTVNTLKVKKGHVRVHGKIGAISREDNLDAVTYIICEDGAEIPSNLGEGFQKMSAAEWDLRKAIANGGTVTLDADIDLVESIVVEKDVTVNLNNKSIKCASSDVFVVTAGTLTINGDGLVWGSEDNSSSSCAVWAKGTGKAIINGGTYKVGDDTSNGKTGNWRNDCIYAKEQASIEINGGEFMYTGENPAGHTFLLNLKDSDGATLVVKGGKFHKFNPAASNGENPIANFVAAGYSSVAEGEYFLVKEGVYNETALKAAMVDDAEVILKSDIELTDYLEIRDVDVVINLNGHTISHSVNSTARYKDVFEVYGTAELTIEGEGSVVAEDGYSVYATGDSKVNLNGGYYFSPVSVVDARKNAIVTINGGEFKVDGTNNSEGDFGQKYTLNLRDKTGNYAGELAAIIVKGGKFYKYNPAESQSENPVANFVAEGYSSVVEGEYFLVKEGVYNETALKAAIAAGETDVTLDANIDLTSSVEVNRDLVVNLNNKSIKCASSDVFVVTAGTLTINGEGTVYGSEDNSSSSCAVWAKENGTVIINGGTYKVGHDGASKDANKANWRNDCIYARDNAKITINGGEFAYTGDINTENFQSDGNRFLLNCRDDDYKAGTSSITVTGGTFHKFNPGATSSENPVASYVAAGYSSVVGENNTYVVKKDN